MKIPLSMWLLPEVDDQLKYKRLIERFSAFNGRPTFEAHITLFGRVNIEPEPLFTFFTDQTKYQGRFTLKIKRIKKGIPPWKSLFIKFEKNHFLEEFQRRMVKPLEQFRKYDFDPHLSLAYGKCDNDSSHQNISLDTTIGFSSVALVHVPDNINQWNIIKEFKFDVN